MGCGTSRKLAEIRPEQKWDAISLRDFKSSSCFTPFAYGYLYFSLGISLAVYGVDIFTAVNLLAFDTWSSTIEPTQLITFDQAKWIFSICIIASFINLIFEHLRAMRVMKRGSVAECYLDNLAVRLESVRLGNGQGWRRFLVFAELTKSKKGAEYVALFTYFSFQSWLRVIFCSGPRQAVNALTLYAVYKSNLIPTDNTSVGSTLGDFFDKLQTLAQENMQQAVILSGMLFTLVIWVFSMIFLIVAVLFYIFFLWHYIPRQDGGLHGYCERKINKRLMAIVMKTVNKALAKEERNRIKAAQKAGEKAPAERQATLPSLDGVKGDKLAEMPSLSRTETMATLPVYTSRPGTPSDFDFGGPEQKRSLPSRQGTNQSSYSMRKPLIPGAAAMGFDRTASPAPSLPNVDLSDYQQPPRPGTSSSNRGFGGPPMHRAQNSGAGFNSPLAAPAALRSPDGLPAMPVPEPIRSPAPSVTGYGPPMPRSGMQHNMRPPFGDGRSSPAPSMFPNRGPSTPIRSATGPAPMPRQQFPPQRNMTAPVPPRGNEYGTDSTPGYGFNADLERGYQRY
ncbi:hypothetical protein F5Y15DRAFT_166903 [Xylariaceae sp. FL0016]|nr:hypothetical protein F5Y15DRAFT_166903 [Xylariaceae sp. FL0016]